MPQLAQVIHNRSELNAMQGESYVRSVQLYNADVLKNKGYTYGKAGWGAEFGLINIDDPTQVYAIANTTNGKMTWSAAGVLVWAFTAIDTALWNFERAAYYLDVVVPTDKFDPQGTRLNIDRGQITVITHSQP